jgi:hypothetical protein
MIDRQASCITTLDTCLERVRRHNERIRAMFMDTHCTCGDLAPPMLDAIQLFDELQIEYALIGGMAAMLYGRARVTEDIDFVADEDHEDALKRHPEVMRKFHFDPACTWKLYHDSGVTIDIWKDAHARDIIERARLHTLHGRAVPVADPHDLIAMKLRADRPQDDYDISEIVKHTAIEDARIGQLVDDESLARYRAIKRRVGLG